MSNTRGIAAVTATLTGLLRRVDDALAGDPADADLINPSITSRPPDVARTDTSNQLNLFLYQIAANAALRNTDLSTGGASGTARLPLALNLYYVLSAYGDSDEDEPAHRLLGRAMALLHANSVLRSQDIKAALPKNDLYQQIDRIRLTPHFLSNEEMSKLWMTFQTGYRISIVYEASVVLIDDPTPAIVALPVLTRGIGDRGANVNPDLIPRLPTLTELVLPPGQPAARLGATGTGDVIVLRGLNLTGTAVTVDLRHLTQAATNPVTPFAAAPSELSIRVPDDEVGWPAGAYAVSVRVDNPLDPARPSNTLYLALAPRITAVHAPVTLPSGEVQLSLDVRPQVWPDQRCVLFVGDTEVTLGPRATRLGTLAFTLPAPPSGTYRLRLRVDGVESFVVSDFSASPPVYDPSQQVTL